MTQTTPRAVAVDHEAINTLGAKLGEDMFHDVAGGGYGRMTNLDAYAEAISLIFGTPISSATKRLNTAATYHFNELMDNYAKVGGH